MGIFGLYYSLQFLSLSDATVLQFLSPIFTAIGGSIFLNEAFSMREAFAGCEQPTVAVLFHGSPFSQVASLVGVMLIARPTFLFGESQVLPPSDTRDVMSRALAAGEITQGVSPSQRVMAVRLAHPCASTPRGGHI